MGIFFYCEESTSRRFPLSNELLKVSQSGCDLLLGIFLICANR